MTKRESPLRPSRDEAASTQPRRSSVLDLDQRSTIRRDRIAETTRIFQQSRTAFIDEHYEEAESSLDQLLNGIGKELTDSLTGSEVSQYALIEAAASSLLGRIRLLEGQDEEAAAFFTDAGSLYDRCFDKVKTHSNQEYGDYGAALWLSGRKEEAVPILERGVDYQDSCPDTYFFLGQYRQEQEQFPEASRLYNLALDLNPYYFPAKFALASALEFLNDVEGAATAYQNAARLIYDRDPAIAMMLIDQALRLDPDNSTSLLLLGEMQRLEGDFAEAYKTLQRVLEIDTANTEAWLSLGILLGNWEKPEEALHALNRALALDPNNPYILIQRAVTQRDLNFFDEALADLRVCTESEPQLPDAFLELGETLRLVGKYEEALLSLNVALGLKPNYAWALGTVGQVLHAMERNHEAKQALEQALDLEPSLIWAYVELGDVWIDLEVYENALTVFDKALQIDPYAVEALLGKARLLRKMGNPKEALFLVNMALSMWPDSPWALREKGLALAMLDDPDTALQALSHALTRSPDNVYLLLEKAEWSYRTGDYSEALKTAERILQRTPDSFVAWYIKAEALRLSDRSHEAEVAYNEALALEPNDISCLRGKGYTMLALFRNDEALYLFKQVMDLRPGVPLFMTEVALAYKYRGNYIKALDLLDEALAIDADEQWTLSTKADVLCEIGDYEVALTALDHALEINPRDSYSLTTKGWALENLGKDRAAEAVAAYEAALALTLPFPNDLWARKGLANARRLRGDLQMAIVGYKSVIKAVEEQDADLDVNLLPLVGWCHYQLALYSEPERHLDMAINYFMETIALNSDMLSTQFDLALALICSPRRNRALREYMSCLENVQREHVLRQRGLLHVAIDDLEEAIEAIPALSEESAVKQALAELKEAHDKVLIEAPLQQKNNESIC